jgi:hypothetical protein
VSSFLDPKGLGLILVSILVEDMVKDLPERFRAEERKSKLKELLLRDVEHCRKRLESLMKEKVL